MAQRVIHKLESESDVDDALASYIADLSARSIATNGSFSFAISGGALIGTLRKLLEPPYITSIDWSKWLIFFVYEYVLHRLRDDGTNYKIAYNEFLSKVPIPKSNIYRAVDKDHTFIAEFYARKHQEFLERLVADGTLKASAITGFAKFDLILLGMGPDGHIASLFSWRAQHFEKKKWVTSLMDSPELPVNRVTFTIPLINSASDVAIVVTGEEAAEAVKVALGEPASNVLRLPVQKVSPEGTLTWFLDKEAASEI